jgi:apolipoprotein D and lipocalin family protein
MGYWFVHGVKPTYLETTSSNAIERYTLVRDSKNYDVQVDFSYNTKEDPFASPVKSLPQKAWVQGDDKDKSGLWKISPFPLVKMPYIIIEVDDECQDYAVIGYPSRAYCWIMGRKPTMPEETWNMLTQRLVERHQYDLTGLRKVPQVWTAEERQKRGLEGVIPDEYLTKKS